MTVRVVIADDQQLVRTGFRLILERQSDVEVVKQGSEPFLFPFLCCFSHTIQSLGHADPALCREHA